MSSTCVYCHIPTDRLSRLVEEAHNAFELRWMIVEHSQAIEVTAINGGSVDYPPTSVKDAVLLGGRLFGARLELRWAIQAEYTHVVCTCDNLSIANELKDLLSDGCQEEELPDPKEDRILLWGQPAGSDGEKFWFEQRVGRIELPLEWASKDERAVACIHGYQEDAVSPLHWRFVDLQTQVPGDEGS